MRRWGKVGCEGKLLSLAVAAGVTAAAWAVSALDADDVGAMARARAMIDAARPAVCPGSLADAPVLAKRLGYMNAGGPDRLGWVTLSDPERGRLMLALRKRGERLDGYELQAEVPVAGALRPVMMARLAADCSQVLARVIDYGQDGRAKALADLGKDLQVAGPWQPLDPPVPPGNDPGGVRVGHIDSGVNYLLAGVSSRLARKADGAALGFDFWDEDPRPFDLSPTGSPFFPLHHGTAVASILLAEAPKASLIPYRYPRPDMSRMAAVVDAAAEAGAAIVMMPLGSNRREDWQAFAEAAARQPDLLFVVSAGNDGRDIDARPVYPAALDLANMIVVTSADDFGRLAAGSNWGVNNVDVMVPGEGIEVTDHRGATGKASGSSFAVPRLAALAARLKARHPDWQAPELIQAIRKRAAPPMMRGGQVVRFGWIANPLDD